MSSFIQEFKNKACFSYRDQKLGDFTIWPLELEEHASIITHWVNKDYARFWGMNGLSESDVYSYYNQLLMQADKAIFIGYWRNQPAFLFELYDPALHPVSEHYSVEQGDCGMHLLVAPTNLPQSGFSLAVIHTLMQFIFSEAYIRRVVVEPDIENKKIHRLNNRVGFTHIKPIKLENKCAYLAICSRNAFFRAFERETLPVSDVLNGQYTAHLTPYYWEKANRFLLKKIISEFSHELILKPVYLSSSDAGDYYELLANSGLKYGFTARRFKMDHWLVNSESLTRFVSDNGEKWRQEGTPDVLEFLKAIRKNLDISAENFLLYLEEISSTLSGYCYKFSTAGRTAKELSHASYQAVEMAMSEGHPIFVANNGALGFDVNDFNSYAPEVGGKVHLSWLAVSRNRAVFSSIAGVDYKRLIERELDVVTIQNWHNQLIILDLNPDDYYFMPVHPWQWKQKIAITFAAEVASRDIVYLGASPDYYQPQQSIRTFYNISAPHKHYVKTALSVLNMGFMRGLSPEYMLNTPAINQWLTELLEGDKFLAQTGFRVLRETATIGYWHPIYTKELTQGSAYGKMLSALWRESPKHYLMPGERLMTMAALLHIDGQGHALVKSLIESANVAAQRWLEDYFKAYFIPLLHCFYAYDLAFMPHGENVILVLKDNRVDRTFMKDIGEEIGFMNSSLEIPDEISRIGYNDDKGLNADYIFTDVFDGFFRHLSAVFDNYGLLKEEEFWALLAKMIRDYQNCHPEYEDKYQLYDLFHPEIKRNCFNRLQMRNSRQMLDLLNPEQSFQYAEVMQNPLVKM